MFGVTTGQDYNIYFINASDVSAVSALASSKSNLTNEKWKSLYDTQYVPNVGDLYLIIDEFGLGVKLDLNSSSPSWSYLLIPDLQVSEHTFVPGPIRPNTSAISAEMTLNATDMTYSIGQPSSILTFNVKAYNSSMPELTWPDYVAISASTDQTWKAVVSIDEHGWLSTGSLRNQSPSDKTLHVAYGLSTHVPQSSSIQIARLFIVVVIIFFTLKGSFSQQIVTLGAAVSSYLNHWMQALRVLASFVKGVGEKNLTWGEA